MLVLLVPACRCTFSVPSDLIDPHAPPHLLATSRSVDLGGYVADVVDAPNPEIGTAAAVLYSVLASAKAKQVEPIAYVRDLLVQLSGHSPPAAAALLPNT